MQPENSLEKKLNLQVPSPLQKIKINHNIHNNVNFFIKRDDQIHNIVSGNKWRKLKFNIENICSKKINSVISFGGAWSNHLHALAWCCYQLDIQLIAFIRGEETTTPSAMIQDLIRWGVQIKWLDRKTYRQKTDPQFLSQIKKDFPMSMIIPEGGSNKLAMRGVAELAAELIAQTKKIDYLCVAVGSGGTLAGLINVFSETETQIIGIPIVKGGDSLKNQITKLLETETNNWQLISGYEMGGYAKYDQSLASYIKEFFKQHKVLLEPIYTAKLIKAIEDLNQKQFFKKDSNVVILHSGGLQGLRGDRKYNLNTLIENY